MKVFLDAEFMEDGREIEMLSIGLVREDGEEYYAVNAHADLLKANAWVVENVIPHLPTVPRPVMEWAKQYPGMLKDVAQVSLDKADPRVKPPHQIADEIVRFVGPRPEFWGYYADYDWVLLCQLYGRMVDLPRGWPMLCLDIKQLAWQLGDPQLPPHSVDNHGPEHHALADTRWNRDAYQACLRQAQAHGFDLARL